MLVVDRGAGRRSSARPPPHPARTNTTVDWDNLFATLLAASGGTNASDPRGGFAYAVSNLFQVVKSKSAAGFVPNFAAGGLRSQDRTEPPIGAKTVLTLVEKFGAKRMEWVIVGLFDDLLDWVRRPPMPRWNPCFHSALPPWLSVVLLPCRAPSARGAIGSLWNWRRRRRTIGFCGRGCSVRSIWWRLGRSTIRYLAPHRRDAPHLSPLISAAGRRPARTTSPAPSPQCRMTTTPDWASRQHARRAVRERA